MGSSNVLEAHEEASIIYTTFVIWNALCLCGEMLSLPYAGILRQVDFAQCYKKCFPQ